MDTGTLDLPLSAWDEARSNARFETNAPIHQTLGVLVTDVDLAHIANANAMDVALVDAAGKSRQFEAWGDTQPHWITPADDDVGFSVVLQGAPKQAQ